jgi:hypothetical protein
MSQSLLQLTIAIALLVVALRIRLSLHRRRNRDWPVILADFREGHGRLSELSHLAQASRENEFSIADIWTRVNGVFGLWTMYSNMEVLLNATDFVAKQGDSPPTPAERIGHVRTDAIRAQMLIALATTTGAVARIWRPRSSRSPLFMLAMIEKYVASIDEFRVILHDHQPDLLRSYRYFISRQ